MPENIFLPLLLDQAKKGRCVFRRKRGTAEEKTLTRSSTAATSYLANWTNEEWKGIFFPGCNGSHETTQKICHSLPTEKCCMTHTLFFFYFLSDSLSFYFICCFLHLHSNVILFTISWWGWMGSVLGINKSKLWSVKSKIVKFHNLVPPYITYIGNR